MQNTLDGGEAILEAFRNLDVDYVMSSPGSEWGPVWEALARQKVGNRAGPTYISCWHETLAVNLAWGYTAVTGRLQAVLLHAGAGLLQGSMAIHAAHQTQTPMVVLSGEALTYGERDGFDPGGQWYTALSIVGGPQRLVEPIVKWANQATSPSTLYEQVMRAGEMAQRSPAGPIYLNVPIENMVADWTPPGKARTAPPPPHRVPSDADLEAVAKRLIESDYPVIITEAAGRAAAGFNALVALSELLAIPVVENRASKYANFPKDHPLHQGFNIGEHLDDADTVLVIAARTPWYPPSNAPKSAHVIAIDDDPLRGEIVYQSLQADSYLEGNLPETLELLVEAVKAAGVDKAKVAERRARWQAAHDKTREAWRAAEAEARGKTPIDPAWLCAALGEVLPENAVYVDETTTHRGYMQRHLRWNAPHDYIKVPSGLGQGLGCALGVKLALPDRPVVSVIGDGGFLYNPVVQSLGLSMEAGLPILIVVFNNQGYLAMKNNQLGYYPDGTGKQTGIFYGHPINGPDYAELAKPFGGTGFKVEDPDDLVPALKKGMDAVNDGKTCIVNVVIST